MLYVNKNSEQFHDYLNSNGYALKYVNNNAVVTRLSDDTVIDDINDTVFQNLVTSWDEVANEKQIKIIEVKKLAYQKIIALIPTWKQNNFNARMNELNAIAAGNHPTIAQRTLTVEEQSEVTAMLDIQNQAVATRTQSNLHESNISALTTRADVINYDIQAGW